MLSDRSIWNLSIDASWFSFPSLSSICRYILSGWILPPSKYLLQFTSHGLTTLLVTLPCHASCMLSVIFASERSDHSASAANSGRACGVVGHGWLEPFTYCLQTSLWGVCLLYLQRNKSQEVIGTPPGGLPFGHSLSRCSSDNNRKCCPRIYITDCFPGFRRKVPETPACFFRCQ